LKLPIDLITINCNKVDEGKKALEFSSQHIEFNNIYFFSDIKVKGNFTHVPINKINGVSEYNDFILGLGNYIKSPYALVIQDDGHVLSSKKWTNDFLKYDYIGAPWPNDEKWNKRWDKYGNEISDKIKKHSIQNRIGNGGFSLRSKKFLNYCSQFKETGVLAEDIFLTLYNYDKAKDFKISFPDIDLAVQFSYETPLKGRGLRKENKSQSYTIGSHFGWHGKKFLNSDKLLNLKNENNINL